MNQYVEHGLILAVLAGAATYLFRRIFALRGGRISCGCGCGHEKDAEKKCARLRNR